MADAARTAIDEAYCVRVALMECLLSNDIMPLETKMEKEAETEKEEKEEKGVENVIDVIGTSNDVKVLKDGVEVEVMNVVTSDPMDELFIDQSSDSVIAAPTQLEMKSTNDSSGIVVMEVEERKEVLSGDSVEGKVQGSCSGEGRVEVVNKEIVTSEVAGKAELELETEVVKEVVKPVIKEKVKGEDEEDREYFQHLDATVHKDLCLVYLVSQQVSPPLLFLLPFSLIFLLSPSLLLSLLLLPLLLLVLLLLFIRLILIASYFFSTQAFLFISALQYYSLFFTLSILSFLFSSSLFLPSLTSLL